MNCPSCNAVVPTGAAFCPSCGGKVPPTAAPGAVDKVRQKTAANRADERPIDQEVQLWAGGYSAKAMIGSWILAALVTAVAMAAGLLANFGGPGILIAVVVSVAIWFGVGMQLLYRRISVDYELTSQRLVHRRGIFRRVTNRIEVIDIDDVQVDQGFVERMFSVGTIRILSSDTSDPTLTMLGIDQVTVVAKMIDDARREERRKRGLHIETV